MGAVDTERGRCVYHPPPPPNAMAPVAVVAMPDLLFRAEVIDPKGKAGVQRRKRLWVSS